MIGPPAINLEKNKKSLDFELTPSITIYSHRKMISFHEDLFRIL